MLPSSTLRKTRILKRAGRNAARLSMLLLFLMTGNVFAEQWSVQTIAFRDYRDATQLVGTLRNQGYDAYTEFVMIGDQQYARVRVGCFINRDGAEYIAQQLKTITAEAQAVPYTAGADTSFCVERLLGFHIPNTWQIYKQTATMIIFEVEVASQTAYVYFNGQRWRIAQTLQDLPSNLTSNVQTSTPAPSFISKDNAVHFVTPTLESFVLCEGTVLWHDDDSAVVQEGDALVAYRVASQ